MSACAMLTYNNVSPPIFDCIAAKASALGVQISGDSGSASEHGLTVHWNYDRAHATLQLQCTDRPFFIGCSTVNGKIDEAVHACLDTHGATMTAMVDG